MGFKKSFLYFVRNLREKHRVSVRNQHNDYEVWYMHISPLNILSGFLALVALLFIVISIAVAYTPILDFIPGYPGNKSREMLITNIMKLDSLNQEINNMQIYSENIALIMAGKNPVTNTTVQSTDSVSTKDIIGKIAEDSLLRVQMETKNGEYSLSAPDAARKNLRMALDLFPPVKGVVALKFNPQDGRYGISIATTINQEVVSVADGTVISSAWTPEQGYVIYVQHTDNMLSVYLNNTSVMKKIGDRVRGGEVIGYTGRASSDSSAKNLFGFELWHNGVPVDPLGYIVF